jgi:O-antigen ligase
MQLAKKISQISMILVLLAPLIVYSGVQFPYSVPRWAWIIVTVSAFFISSLATATEYKTVAIKKIDIAYGVLIALMCLSLFVTTDVRQTLWSGIARTTGLVLYVVCFAWFAAVKIQNFDKDEWRKNLVFAVGVAGLTALWALVDKFVFADGGMGANEARLSVPAGNALILATYLAPHLFIAALLIAERITFKLSRGLQIFVGICAAVIALATALTFSRSSYVGIVAGVAFVLIGYGSMIYKTRNKKSFRRVAMAMLTVILLTVTFYAYARTTNLGSARLKITADSFSTLRTRFINWKIAFRSIEQHPIIGVGWENYRSAVDRLFDPSLSNFSYYETRIDKPHNAIIEIWVTLGTIGLVAYLFLLYSMITTAWRLLKQNKITLLGFWALVGFVVAYQFQNLFAFDTPQTLFTQGLVLAFLSAYDDSIYEVSLNYFHKARTPIIISSAILCSGLFVYAGWAPLRTMWYVNKGLTASQQHDFNTVDSSMRSAFSGVQGPYYFETWRWFAESLLKNYASGSQKLSDLSPEQRLRWDEDALQIAKLTKKYGDENPDSFEWQTFAGKVSYFLALAKKDDVYLEDARKYFLHAFEISHVRQEPPILLSYVYTLQGDKKQAIAWYVTAVKLSPTAETASALDWMINRFVGEKDAASAIMLLENSVQYAPNATDYARLAAAYAGVARFDDAKIAVEKAVELDATFAQEAQNFISGFPKK